METIENIKKKIKPIAEKYGVGKVILFGSYARGEEKASSDLDFMISKGKIRGAFGLCCFIDDLQHQFDLPIGAEKNFSQKMGLYIGMPSVCRYYK